MSKPDFPLNIGTPKDLEGAIANGLKYRKDESPEETLRSIALHVRDFAAQGLGSAFMSYEFQTADVALRRLCRHLGVREPEE